MSDAVFVDASVIAAILLGDPDADFLEDRIIEGKLRLTSAIAVFEATLAVSNRKAKPLVVAQTAVMDYVIEFGLKFVDIDAEVGRIALEARARYGKGTGHPARLNLGDCIAYACAKAHKAPLLYKGDDFVHTDLA